MKDVELGSRILASAARVRMLERSSKGSDSIVVGMFAVVCYRYRGRMEIEEKREGERSNSSRDVCSCAYLGVVRWYTRRFYQKYMLEEAVRGRKDR